MAQQPAMPHVRSPAGAPPPPVPDPPPDPPPPTSQDDEKHWTIAAAHFRDDGDWTQVGDDGVHVWGGTSRSEPFAWDRITADNLDQVRVSIGGNVLPFSNTAAQPVFDADLSGAEWTITAVVGPGTVVLVLDALDSMVPTGEIRSIEITNRGSGYNGAPTVTFSGGGGSGAAAIVPGYHVQAVSFSPTGLGYLSAPTLTFSGGGGTGAAATVERIHLTAYVYEVVITDGGSGYASAPTVTFSRDSQALVRPARRRCQVVR